MRADAALKDPDMAIGASRFELLTELRRRLLERDRPLLHVIEDIQWADVTSVLLLAHIAAAVARHQILILVTLRTGEPVGPALEGAIEEVRRAAAVRTIPPLPGDAVAQLIRDAGIEPDSPLAERCEHAPTGTRCS